MRILVVDDNKLIRTILCKLLEDFGSVEAKKSGEEGVAAFKDSLAPGAEPYALVCMDMSMGAGMSGDVAVARMRELEEESDPAGRRRARILMVTAFADKDSVLKTKDLCDGYLLKPIVREKLFAKLETFGFFPELKPAGSTPEEPAERPAGSADAEEIAAQADLSAWDKAPLLASRGDAIVALVPRPGEKPGDPPRYVQTALDKAEFLASVKPLRLAARAETSSLPLDCGPGMAYIPKLKAFVARRGGKAVLRDGLFDIDPELHVKGDLRFKNIDFAGKLTVDGDVVGNGLLLRADEGVEIAGDVGRCRIESAGDVKLRRFNGRGGGAIVSGGSVFCEYAYDAKLQAAGDVDIAREAVNCEIECLGAVRAGTIIGQRTTAFMSIELERAGSPKEINTVLRAGFDYRMDGKIAAAQAKLDALDAEMTRLEQMLGPYANEFKSVFALPERQQARVFEMAGRRLMIKYSERPEALSAYEDAKENAGRFPAAKISIEQTAFKGVRFEIGTKSESFLREASGPISITTLSDESRYLLEF